MPVLYLQILSTVRRISMTSDHSQQRRAEAQHLHVARRKLRVQTELFIIRKISIGLNRAQNSNFHEQENSVMILW